jgi:hypothetical protein
VRATSLALLAVGLIGACTEGQATASPSPVARSYATASPTPVAAACIDSYSSSGLTFAHVNIPLTVKDNGRSVTAHLCDWIDVLLVGHWSTVQSSDETLLKVVPLPLHEPPPGGTNLVYEAERTGSAVLSSVSLAVAACPPTLPTAEQTVCLGFRWSATVTVLT